MYLRSPGPRSWTDRPGNLIRDVHEAGDALFLQILARNGLDRGRRLENSGRIQLVGRNDHFAEGRLSSLGPAGDSANTGIPLMMLAAATLTINIARPARPAPERRQKRRLVADQLRLAGECTFHLLSPCAKLDQVGPIFR